MKKTYFSTFLFLLTLLSFSCWNLEPAEDFMVEGLRPVYITEEVADSVTASRHNRFPNSVKSTTKTICFT